MVLRRGLSIHSRGVVGLQRQMTAAVGKYSLGFARIHMLLVLLEIMGFFQKIRCQTTSFMERSLWRWKGWMGLSQVLKILVQVGTGWGSLMGL